MEASVLIDQAHGVYRAYRNRTRKDIIALIMSKGEINVSDMYKRLKLEQSVCSQQLGILRRAGLLNARKSGKEVFYSINDKKMSLLVKVSDQLVNS